MGLNTYFERGDFFEGDWEMKTGKIYMKMKEFGIWESFWKRG